MVEIEVVIVDALGPRVRGTSQQTYLLRASLLRVSVPMN